MRSDRDGTRLNLDFSVEGLQQPEEGPWVSNAGMCWPLGMGELTWEGDSSQIWGGNGS